MRSRSCHWSFSATCCRKKLVGAEGAKIDQRPQGVRSRREGSKPLVQLAPLRRPREDQHAVGVHAPGDRELVGEVADGEGAARAAAVVHVPAPELEEQSGAAAFFAASRYRIMKLCLKWASRTVLLNRPTHSPAPARRS